MLVKNISHDAVNTAYTLLSSYLREDGKLSASYDKDHLKEFQKFLYEILNNPLNFSEVVVEDTGNSAPIPV